MILKPLLFNIKVVQVMVKKKYQHQKPGWGGEGKINRPGQVAPHPCTIFFFYFSDIENKFIGLVL